MSDGSLARNITRLHSSDKITPCSLFFFSQRLRLWALQLSRNTYVAYVFIPVFCRNSRVSLRQKQKTGRHTRETLIPIMLEIPRTALCYQTSIEPNVQCELTQVEYIIVDPFDVVIKSDMDIFQKHCHSPKRLTHVMDLKVPCWTRSSSWGIRRSVEIQVCWHIGPPSTAGIRVSTTTTMLWVSAPHLKDLSSVRTCFRQ